MKMNYRVIWIFLFQILHCQKNIFAQERSCFTTSGIAGKCVLLHTCPELQHQTSILSITEFLAIYNCGLDSDGNARVCCPVESPKTNIATPSAKHVINTDFVVPNHITNLNCGRRYVGNGPEWPFMMVLGRYRKNEFTFKCSGVLISDSWILMGAKCILDAPISHAITVNDFINDVNDNIYQVITKRRGKFNVLTYENNIALIKISPTVNFNENIQPVCLPSETTQGNDNYLWALSGGIKNETVSGSKKFGRVLHVKGVSRRVDSCPFETLPSAIPHTENQICTTGNHDCRTEMDLVLIEENHENGRFSVVGTGALPDHEFTGFCDYELYPESNIYTKVYNSIKWIASVLQ